MIAVSGALTASGADSRLQALHLRKSYGSNEVLKGIDLQVQPGVAQQVEGEMVAGLEEAEGDGVGL